MKTRFILLALIFLCLTSPSRGQGSLIPPRASRSILTALRFHALPAAPTDSLESAILISVAPGSYTAIVKGADGGTGNGLVEVYKLGP